MLHQGNLARQPLVWILAGVLLTGGGCSVNQGQPLPAALASESQTPASTAAPIVLVQAQKPLSEPALLDFINEMAAKHGFDHGELLRLFEQVSERDDIIAKITRPAERTKPWHEYRAIFLDQARIDAGVEFWRQQQAALNRAVQVYGVAPEIIVAIIGVETRYGRITGKDPVLEALATLAFAYPRRAAFFRQELEHYLLLTREERIDPLSLNGSYAGAMGLAQFMPSSYRAYAVDFDGDGQRDLWQNPVDAIGSVANYLAEHGWRPGGPIASPAQVQGQAYRTLLSDQLKPRVSVQQFQQAGVTPVQTVNPTEKAILLELEGAAGTEYWLGFTNFYVITRYNHSHLYAMAVYQLAQAIQQAMASW